MEQNTQEQDLPIFLNMQILYNIQSLQKYILDIFLGCSQSISKLYIVRTFQNCLKGNLVMYKNAILCPLLIVNTVRTTFKESLSFIYKWMYVSSCVQFCMQDSDVGIGMILRLFHFLEYLRIGIQWSLRKRVPRSGKLQTNYVTQFFKAT